MAEITSVGTEVVGPREATLQLGTQLADSLRLEGPVVIVRAKLKSKTFTAQHQKNFYYSGMLTKTEIKVSSKPFLVTLVPALEKYLPD
jgi:membrane fusion protein (multidrug efflux system)